MNHLIRSIAIISMLLAVGCAHKIDISPPLNTLDGNGINKINKTVGYYISPADRTKEVTTPGGGGDKVKYLPYQDLEPALSKMLSNVFVKVVSLPALDDKQYLVGNNIAYVFVPIIETDSSSESILTWPPTKFTVSLDCKAVNSSGNTLWRSKVSGEGQAVFSDFKHDFSLAARRASKNAFMKLQQEISAAKEIR
jgi:hypothetical protein